MGDDVEALVPLIVVSGFLIVDYLFWKHLFSKRDK